MSGQSDLYFKQILLGQMGNFVYLVGSQSARQAVIVDPAWDIQGLLDLAAADGVEVVGALATHYHQDHIGGSIMGMEIQGVAELLAKQPMPIHVNDSEADGLKKITGASESDVKRVSGGDTIEIGGITIRLLHTPGHTPGSQCFLVEEAGQPGYLVSGDTLFLNSCGRVDLPGGNPEDMYRSLNETLKRLPDDTLVFPGHAYGDEHDSLGNQKQTNPLLRVSGLEQFLAFMGAG